MSALVGCGDETPSSTTQPSPLLSANSDRLWILLRASRVGDGRECEEHYLIPDDPRYQGVAQRCDVWTRDFADYLRINGFPAIEHLHLKDPVYWNWFVQKRAEIQSCRNALGVLPVPTPAEERQEHYQRRNECDPYDNAINNQKLTPTELGIEYQ